jgi:molybdopterin-synthase adenylyltransferase
VPSATLHAAHNSSCDSNLKETPWMPELSTSSLPRIKPIYPIYRVSASTFRIGAQFGITSEFDDPEGHVWALVHLMDGTRDIHGLAAEMQRRYPGLSHADVESGILALDEAGFVEDARPTAYDGLQHTPLTRFAGNVNYFSHYMGLRGNRAEAQDRLRDSSVVLLGLGGGGSSMLPLLAAAGIGRIVGVDYDRVELSNLNRQFLFRESDVGRLKTRAAERVMAELNSAVDFSTHNLKVQSSDDLRPIIRGADLVICAIDEPPFVAQRRVNAACIAENVTCLYGMSQITSGRMCSVVPKQSGCFDCLNVYYSKHDPVFVDQFRGFYASHFNPPTISFAPEIVRLASMIASEACRLLTHCPAPQSIGKQVEFDFISGSVTVLTTWPRYPDECPTCGSGRELDWPVFSVYADAVRDQSAA